MGAIHHVNRFVSNLAATCDPFRELLKGKEKNKKLDWNTAHEAAFSNVKTETAKITENPHFQMDRPTRIVCDASRAGLGACLQQEYTEGWRPIAFASRFLNSCEAKYSTNELEFQVLSNWATL